MPRSSRAAPTAAHAAALRPRGPARRAADGPLRTILADPDAIARGMLSGLLRDDAHFVVAGVAGHAIALINVVKLEAPDLVVIDAALPPDGAVSAVQATLARRPHVAIVVLADVDDDDPAAADAALAVLRAGGRGYLDRRLRPGGMIAALAGAAHGEAALSRTITMQLLTRLAQMPEGGSGLRPVRSPLTDREWEVLDLLGAGLSTAQIAAQLVVSNDTVRSHVKRILRKLEVHNRAAAVVAARQLRRRA